MGGSEYIICHDWSARVGDAWMLRNLYDEEVFYGACVARLNAHSIINTSGLVIGSAYEVWARTGYDCVLVHVVTIKHKLHIRESTLYVDGNVDTDPYKRFCKSSFMIVPDASSFASIERLR